MECWLLFLGIIQEILRLWEKEMIFFFNSFRVSACSGIYQGKVNKVTYLGGMILAKMDENSRMMPALVPR